MSDVDLKKPFFVGQDGTVVGWEAGPTRRCATCHAPWGPVPGRGPGITACTAHPFESGHDVVEDVWSGAAAPEEPRRPASDEALVTLKALHEASERFLGALEAADGVLRQELAQEGPPSVLQGLQGRVHNITDAIQGDLPLATAPIAVKGAVKALIRDIQEATR